MEQVRMAPVSTLSYVLGKTFPYFVARVHLRDGHPARRHGALRGADARIVAAALSSRPRCSCWARSDGPADLDARRHRSRSRFRSRCWPRFCRRCSCRASSSRSRACRVAVQWRHLHRAGPLLPGGAARHRPQGRRTRPSSWRSSLALVGLRRDRDRSRLGASRRARKNEPCAASSN